MGHSQRIELLSADEYLAWEAQQPTRNEFVAGRVHATVGASKAHNLIALNVVVGLRTRLKAHCRVFALEVKVRVDAADAYYYPDAAVSCDPRDRDPHVIRHPSLVVEVLSPGTMTIDRREKLPAYQSIPGLRAVLLVHQERRAVEVCRRDELGWLVETVEGDETAEVPELGLALPLDEIYAGTGDPTPG
jgi:Uma2 family endonuclease